VVAINAVGERHFAPISRNVVGRSLKEILLLKNPEWKALLSQDWVELAQQPVFFAWDQQKEPGLGWTLSVLKLPETLAGGWSLTFAPSVSPDLAASTPEEGLGPMMGLALHHLFFRTQQVEARFQYFLRLLPGVPYSQGTDLSFTHYNEKLHGLIGDHYIEQLAKGFDWQEWIHSDDRAAFEKNLEVCLHSRTPTATRFRLIPHRNDIFYILDIRLPVRSLGGEIVGFEGLWLDLTRQTLAEKRLLRASWKESLAEITGSLSHDFNNILTGIVNLSNLMSEDSQGETKIQGEDIRIINHSASQAQSLIQRIVSLNRQDIGEVTLHNLVSIVDNHRDLIRIILPRNVRFLCHLPKQEMPVRLDASALERILLNFATNARDAIGYGGLVQIHLREVDLAAYPRSHLVSSLVPERGKGAELVFEDDGAGIDPGILNRIFGPYFSTKQAARGSGLGLYSLTRFAQENGFDFGVRSKLGQGTEMILLIPLENPDLPMPLVPEEEAFPQVPPRPKKTGPHEARREVGFYTALDDQSLQLTRELIIKSVHPEILEDPQAAVRWLKSRAHPGNVFFAILDPRRDLPEDLTAALQEVEGQLERVLCIRGMNPDAVRHSQLHNFDRIFEEFGDAEENAKAILGL